MAALQRQGLLRHIGVSNVTRAQIDEARSVAEIERRRDSGNLDVGVRCYAAGREPVAQHVIVARIAMNDPEAQPLSGGGAAAGLPARAWPIA